MVQQVYIYSAENLYHSEYHLENAGLCFTADRNPKPLSLLLNTTEAPGSIRLQGGAKSTVYRKEHFSASKMSFISLISQTQHINWMGGSDI